MTSIPTASSSFSAPTGTAFTAAPSAISPSPTPASSVGPSQGLVPVPTPRIVYVTPKPLLPPATPRPTQPLAPSPTCFHPGQNHGVDECRWPHN